MAKPLIVVTGRNGQLGFEIEQISNHFSSDYNFIFTGRDVIDLGNPETIHLFFLTYKPDYFINCAAYTAVDKAESEQTLAYQINAASVGLIADYCTKIDCKLITISTDYVFNGNNTIPYLTDEKTDPINYYGYSKMVGEQLAIKNQPQTIVIRTSWVYSSHGNNFVKSMIRLMQQRNELKIVNDQIGSPTYAKDLAMAILRIVQKMEQSSQIVYGVYHFANEGVISWYDFAVQINKLAGLSNCSVFPIPSSDYPTPAKRPFYSVLNKESIVTNFGIELIDWKTSLESCMNQLLSK